MVMSDAPDQDLLRDDIEGPHPLDGIVGVIEYHRPGFLANIRATIRAWMNTYQDTDFRGTIADEIVNAIAEYREGRRVCRYAHSIARIHEDLQGLSKRARTATCDE
jgi:hypothetical protein